jgi:hypothetical protein
MEDWARDDDQDDVADVDEIADEFDTPSTNDALPQLSSCKEVADVSAPIIKQRKPRLPVMPPIWAESRQEVCESFDYFRSYQSGVYSLKDIVKGYLLGGSPASRDIFHCGGRLIISHGGGKAESILDYRVGPARFQQAQDQEATDKSVRALLKSYTDKRPLVLLADDKYALFPYDLGATGCTYVVLGLYWISHAWAEYQPASNGCGRVVRWKFAFQWCEGQGNPWWTSSKSDDVDILPDPMSSSSSAPRQDPSPPNAVANVACKKCSQESPVVYSQGWMCLNPSCTSFWSIGGRELEQLDYDTTFLRPISMVFTDLPELRPAKLMETMDSITTSYAFSRGWHCEKCGRLSSRFKWEHWECSYCHSIHKIPGRLRIAKEFWHQRPLVDYLHSHVGKQSGITTSHQSHSNWAMVEDLHTTSPSFFLMREEGSILYWALHWQTNRRMRYFDSIRNKPTKENCFLEDTHSGFKNFVELSLLIIFLKIRVNHTSMLVEQEILCLSTRHHHLCVVLSP